MRSFNIIKHGKAKGEKGSRVDELCNSNNMQAASAGKGGGTVRNADERAVSGWSRGGVVGAAVAAATERRSGAEGGAVELWDVLLQGTTTSPHTYTH